MKQVVAGILLILMMLQVFYQFSIMASFYANRQVIAATLCINKDKPELRCKGRCFLKKQLQKAEEQEQKQNTVAPKYEILPFLVENTAELFEPCFEEIPVITGFRSSAYTYLMAGSVFHPPCA